MWTLGETVSDHPMQDFLNLESLTSLLQHLLVLLQLVLYSKLLKKCSLSHPDIHKLCCNQSNLSFGVIKKKEANIQRRILFSMPKRTIPNSVVLYIVPPQRTL